MRPWGPRRHILKYGSFSAVPVPGQYTDIVDYLDDSYQPAKNYRNKGGGAGIKPLFFRRASASTGTPPAPETKPPSPAGTRRK